MVETDAEGTPVPTGVLARLTAEATLLPPRVGHRQVPIEVPLPRLARQDGFSLHADREVHGNDREGLEGLCRYGLRPAVARDRLKLSDDGRVSYRMKRTFSDGTREIVLTPSQLLGRLAALVPPPRVHAVRYHGAFAPNARGRAALSGRRQRSPRPVAVVEERRPPPPEEEVAPPTDPARPRRLPWADLLRRVHRVDVLVCARCHGRLRVLAFITMPDVTAAILTHLGLPATPPAIAPARSPPQADLFDGWSDDAFPHALE